MSVGGIGGGGRCCWNSHDACGNHEQPNRSGNTETDRKVKQVASGVIGGDNNCPNKNNQRHQNCSRLEGTGKPRHGGKKEKKRPRNITRGNRGGRVNHR